MNLGELRIALNDITNGAVEVTVVREDSEFDDLVVTSALLTTDYDGRAIVRIT